MTSNSPKFSGLQKLIAEWTPEPLVPAGAADREPPVPIITRFEIRNMSPSAREGAHILSSISSKLTRSYHDRQKRLVLKYVCLEFQ